jgi:uncharacterized protein with GYD domain
MGGAYLIEHYRAGAGIEELRRSAAQVRDVVAEMEREGIQVRHLSSTIVGGDSYLASVLEASDQGVACEAFRRAGISFERVSPAISIPGSEAISESRR